MARANRSFLVEKLQVKIYRNRETLGQAAAKAVGRRMKTLLEMKKVLHMVFASAPSQSEFLETLGKELDLDWKRVVAFHLDEYVGLPETACQNFGRFLRVRLFEKVQPGKVYYLNGMAKDPEAECERYATLLQEHGLDIACIGIGENGHLAFNDPPVARFDDTQRVKVVELDLTSRQQQVHDGCFTDLENVPRRAMTLTLPSIFASKYIYCMVPGPTKAEAVKRTLEGPLSTACPASGLRNHPHAILFLDRDSTKLISSQ